MPETSSTTTTTTTTTAPRQQSPFAMVYDALWSLLARHKSFGALVAVGNRIRYDDPQQRDPLKQQVASADLPELVLVSEGLNAAMYNTSSTSSCTRNYTWLLSTGDLRLTELLYPVEWAIFCAMHGWKTTLTGLLWQSKRFVTRTEIASVTEGESVPDRNRGIKGWSAAWKCRVDMAFVSADLLGELDS